MSSKVITVLFSLVVCLPLIFPCNIWGTDSGECSLQPLSKTWREENLPFCGKVVQYPACIPKLQVDITSC